MAKGNGIQLPWDPVELTWQGKEYVIPPQAIMGAIARVEDHITLFELITASATARPPLGKISQAYASLLRYAGASVQDLEVYSAMFKRDGEPEHTQDTVGRAIAAIQMLQKMMTPPDMRPQPQEVADGAPLSAPVTEGGDG